MAKQLERQKVAQEVLSTLRSRILGGHYEPGAKLPPERELAKELVVNRASLREALKKLEHLGLVTIRQGDGTRVTNFHETAGIELLTHLIPLTPTLAPDIFEFRRLFGREVARMAAERADDADVARLRDIAARARDSSLSMEQVFDVDFEFYAALSQVARNRVISMLVNTVRKSAEQYRPLLSLLIVSRARVSTHHDSLLDAVEARDPETAARVADEYLQAGADHVLKG